MLTITISARALLLTALLALSVLAALYAPGVRGSGELPDQVIQGDVDCDGDVDAVDALGILRYVAGLPVSQNDPCIDIATVAAIPGPPGPQGPAGPQGEQGPPGEPGPENVLFASINLDGEIQAGDALDSFIDQFGVYRITFGRNVSQCAATVSPGSSIGGPNPIAFSTVALTHAVHAGQGSADRISVSFRDQTQAITTLVQTDFHLIVAC